ncbi:hypothetical protein [Bacillus sp. Marseille-P3661]|uniref:hypothetical protein n=1 Tax=Bacillus sp. Marseille-P3661 TaxID=1936234 RepID=UPI000C8537DD|nr:hypothetical protein [Bacillus sp. Marseille-P3661]
MNLINKKQLNFSKNALKERIDLFIHLEQRKFFGKSHYRSGTGPVLIAFNPAVKSTFMLAYILHDYFNLSMVGLKRNSCEVDFQQMLTTIADKYNKRIIITVSDVSDEQNDVELQLLSSSPKHSAILDYISMCFKDYDIPNVDCSHHDSPHQPIILNIGVHSRLRDITNTQSLFINLLCSLAATANLLCRFDFNNEQPLHAFSISSKNISSIFPHHRVELAEKSLDYLNLTENDYVTIYNFKNGLSRRCMIKINNNLEDYEIIIGKSTSSKLNIKSTKPSQLIIQKHPVVEIHHYSTQSVDILKHGKIIVSEDIYNRIDKTSHTFEIMNTVTGSSFDFSKTQLEVNKNLKAGTVQLSYLQREFLNYELPPDQLSSYYYQRFTNNSNLTETERQFLIHHYQNEKVISKLEYEDRLKMKNILKKAGYISISIYPLKEYSYEINKDYLERLKNVWLSKFIGDASLNLKVIRPYSTDEASNAIRMSPSALKLLGVQEADTVILRHRSKAIKARVLEMDSIDLIRETNIMTSESNMNISIGIPAHIRGKLGLKFINKVIKVERDTNYLFKKNLNLQFIPIIAVLLTAFTLNIDPVLRTILCVGLIPLSIYLVLSKVREEISND